MRFSEYINGIWDADEFCRLLADEARSACGNLFEMAMGSQKIEDSKFGIMHDSDDYKFVSQFPYNVWTDALNWRYNQGLRDMMRKSAGTTDIPEDHDWTDEITLPVGQKYYRFGKKGGEKNIYIGLTKLAKKLTSPSKGFPEYEEKHPDNPDEVHPHWAGEGPSLREIDPKQKDETHPAHPKNYKHGLYDFDLSGMAEVMDEDIEKIPDQDIQAFLGPPMSEMPVKHPEVQKAIHRIRAKMKDVKKHTFAAYSVPQRGTTAKNVSDWVNANALKLYGDHPEQYFDELTGKTHIVGEKTPEQLYDNDHYKNVFKKKGNEDEDDASLLNKIPTIDKHIAYDELNSKGKVVASHNGLVTIPHLNPQKAIPQLHKAEGAMKITPEQRLQIAQFRAKRSPDKWPMASTWQVGYGEKLPEAMKKWGEPFRAASKIDTFKNFLLFWDIWTPEQKHWLKQNSKTLIDMAKRVHSKEMTNEYKKQLDEKIKFYQKKVAGGEQLTPEEKADLENIDREQLSKPQNLYIAGPRPNQASQSQGVLNIPADNMTAFKKKYLPKLMSEILGDATKGAGQGYNSNSMFDRIINKMARDPKNPPQVIAALKNRDEDLATYAAYNLLTWLNDPLYGMGSDKEFNILVDKNENPINVDSESNKIRRQHKVEMFLQSAAQYGFNDVLSRRNRIKHGGMGLEGSYDAPSGESGQSSAGQVTASQKAKEVPELAAKRRWLHSDPSDVARAGQKNNSLLTDGTNQFLARKRNLIVKKLKGDTTADAELQAAADSYDKGLQLAIELYQKYDKELEAKFPNEVEREEEIMKLVSADLSKHASISHAHIEDVLGKAKSLITAGKVDPNDLKLKEAMDDFMSKFISLPKGKSIQLPAWNDIENKAVESGKAISPSELPPEPHHIGLIISHLYKHPQLIIDAMKQWGFRAYEKVVKDHDDVHKDTTQLNKEWQAELATWGQEFANKWKISPDKLPQHQPMPQQPAAAQPAPAVAAKAIGQSLPELFSWAGKVGSVEDMIRVGQGLLDKKAELLAQKGSADQVEQAIKAMVERRKFIKANYSPQEHKMIHIYLPTLRDELKAAHE